MNKLTQLLEERFPLNWDTPATGRKNIEMARRLFTEGYNARKAEENPAIAKAVENLPKWLRDAANVLNLHAERNGAQSSLSPKLNLYANKIEKALAL